MAIISNRSKLNVKKINKLGYNKFSLVINAFIILMLSVILIKPNIIKSPNFITEINGIIISNIINPFVKVGNFLADSTFGLINYKNLHTENLLLKSELQKQNIILKKLKYLEEKNLKLEKILKVAMNEPENVVRASIISYSKSYDSNNIMVSAGEKNGIRKNNVVLCDGYLAGRIVDISNNFSKIMPINDYNSRISIKTLETNVRAIFKGNGLNGGVLIHLPNNKKPKLGEVVVTSGDGHYFCPELPIGQIIAIKNDQYEVEIFSDLSKIDYVTILK